MKQIFLKWISLGIDRGLEQSAVNRIMRINFFYLVLVLMLFLSIILSAITGELILLWTNVIFLIISIGAYLLFPAAKKPQISGLLGLLITGLIFLYGYLFNMGVSASLVLAFYLLYPLAGVAVVGRAALYPAAGLGLLTILFSLLPSLETGVQLSLYNGIIFFVIYTLVVLLALYLEKSNREILENLKDSRDRAEMAVIEKDEFIGKLSHKLRTSLGNIALINNLVHDQRLGSNQKELLDTLKSSTNTLIQDVDNIVEIAAPGTVDFRKSIVSFNLSSILQEASAILRSGTPSLEIALEQSGLPAHQIIGDPSLIRSLIVQIAHGLSSYRSKLDPMHLKLQALKETPGQIRLQFSFQLLSDHGNELIRTIHQMHQGEAKRGSSLGNAYALLAENESMLSAEATGEKVSLSFAYDFSKDPTRLIEQPEVEVLPEKPEKEAVDLTDAKILLVEDNVINQKIVLMSLNNKVKRVDVAGHGKEALEFFGLRKYDLILMDIMMPVMDGLTAIKKIREIEATGETHIPIIAVTANALAGDRENCLSAGANDYLAKPFTADQLLMKMESLLA